MTFHLTERFPARFRQSSFKAETPPLLILSKREKGRGTGYASKFFWENVARKFNFITRIQRRAVLPASP